jgi:hypothetical protein
MSYPALISSDVRYNGVTIEAIASNSDADTPSVIGILIKN